MANIIVTCPACRQQVILLESHDRTFRACGRCGTPLEIDQGAPGGCRPAPTDVHPDVREQDRRALGGGVLPAIGRQSVRDLALQLLGIEHALQQHPEEGRVLRRSLRRLLGPTLDEHQQQAQQPPAPPN